LPTPDALAMAGGDEILRKPFVEKDLAR